MSSPLGSQPPVSASVRPIVSVLAQLFSKGEGPPRPPVPGTPQPQVPAMLPPTGGPASAAPAWAQALAGLRAPHVDLGEALARLARGLRAGEGRGADGGAADGLRRLLARFGQVADLDGAGLRERIEAGGVLFESRLVATIGRADAARKRPNLAQLLDLKAELLRSEAALPRGPVRRDVSRALVAIEEQQLHNVARAEHGEAPLLVIPLPDGDGWTTAWLQRRDENRGEADEFEADGGARVAFGVTFSALGPVRADLTLRPDSLWVRISVAREPVLRALESEQSRLAKLLERDGRTAHVSVVLADADDLETPPPVVDGQLDVSA